MRALRAALRLSSRRIRTNLAVSVGVVISMASLMAIWVGVPLYAEAASSRLLNTQIDEASGDSVPFGYLFSFNRLSSQTQTWDSVSELSDFLSGRASFGSEVSGQHRVTETLPFDLFAAGDLDLNSESASGEDLRLDRLAFTSVNTFDDRAFTLTSGRHPSEDSATSVAEVWLSDELSETLGVDTGDDLVIVNPRKTPEDPDWSSSIQVAGTWTATSGDQRSEGRFLRTGAVRGSLLVTETTMAEFVAPLDSASIASAQWLVLLDPGQITTDNVDALVERSNQLSREVDEVLPGTRMSINPGSSLQTYQDDVLRLNDGLASFSIPTLVMLFAVFGLAVAMNWRTRNGELTMLRSRGIRSRPLVAAGIIEALVLAAIAIPLGIVAAGVVARLIGRTETFLRLGDVGDLTIVANNRAIQSVLTVAALAVVTQLVPFAGLSRWTHRARQRVVDGKRSGPWWQRGRADLVVAVIVGGFAWFVLSSQTISGNLLEDPVVILLPAALTLASGLVVLRIVPLVASACSRVVERTNSTSALLAFRKAERTPAASAAPLLLLVLTGALSIYTASLARTIDLQLVDQAHHVIGGNNRIETTTPPPAPNFGLPVQEGPPVEAGSFERIWGLDAASRIAVLPGRAQPRGGGNEIPIEVRAVDPETFVSASFWRSDYATQTLPTLMERLARNRDGVVLRQNDMAQNDISIGDTIEVRASNGDVGITLPMVVVGHYDQFPAWQPSNPLSPAIVSLPDLEQRLGRSLPGTVIYSQDSSGRDDGQTRADFARLGVDVGQVRTAAELIERAQFAPERQGVFGLLTVSFLLSSALTIAGFVFYAITGARRQLTELAMLRAAGLSQRSLLTFVTFDLLIVAFFGIGAAVAIGATMSRVLLPRLVGTSVGSAPRLLPEIDWLATTTITAALVVVFVTATVGLLVVLRRIRLFEAIKIGAPR